MIALSRFSHVFDLGEYVALFHSLRMLPAYMNKSHYHDLKNWMETEGATISADIPELFREDITELLEKRIISKTPDEDEKVLAYVRSRIPEPAISVCYMILSEQCNLACRYCFLGNNEPEKRKQFSLQNMTRETADSAVQFFVKQLKKSGIAQDELNPVIIFYGGEPLVNYSVLVHIAETINKMKQTEGILANVSMSMVTNGLLLNEERLKKLKELNVGIAISIDGFTENANKMRVDVGGNAVYSRILQKLDLCKSLGVPVSLSVTLSEETIKDKVSILSLVEKFGIKSFGFNIMMSSDTFILPESYNEKAAQFIIDEFVELRKLGIYEDRMMRKLKSFAQGQVYFSDCAATSGGQIVVAPNGRVGVCHGCLYDKKYFVSDVFDDEFDASTNAVFKEWSQLSPVNKDECLSCRALGICGGGCPINASYLKKGNTIHSIDERFCVHAKKTLDFFIADLFRIVSERNQHSDK